MLSITLQSASDLETLRESCELECKLAAGQDGKGEFLSLTGSGRGAVYRFTQVDATSPDDVFGSGSSAITESSSTISGLSSTINASSSTINASSSAISEGRQAHKRDEKGRLISDKFHLPFVDTIETLDPGFLADLESLAAQPKAKKRLEREELSSVIISLCEGHFITIKSLAHLLQRQEKTLRQDYLSKLCKEQRLRRAFPDTPNHEKQAYTKA